MQADSVLFPNCGPDQSVRVLVCVRDLCVCMLAWEGWMVYVLMFAVLGSACVFVGELCVCDIESGQLYLRDWQEDAHTQHE